jgi:hypothetical protein
VAIIEAENQGKGADEAIRIATQAGYEVGPPYEAFVRRYFAERG